MSQAKYFRRAKSEWSLAIPSGPTGALGLQKFRVYAIPRLRLAMPSQRLRSVFAVGATLAVARKPSPLKGEGAPEGGG